MAKYNKMQCALVHLVLSVHSV